MTGVATALTAEADARLADYLRHVRAALAGVPDVSPDDVEADIRDHVAAELRGRSSPVTAAELGAVLAALGPPANWRPAGAEAAGFDWRAAAAAARRAARRRVGGAWDVLWRGPEDWRLAYLCLLCVVLAPLTLGVSLIAAYLLGRAAASLAAEKGERLGARRWLVYPAVVAVSGPVLLTAVAAPSAAGPVVYWNAVHPAEVYRDAIQAVAPDGIVTFRPGVNPEHNYQFRSAGINGDFVDRNRRREWRMSDADRRANDRVLAVLDRVPVVPELRGYALAGLVGLGAALAWWLVLGGAFSLFPVTISAVLFPLLNGVSHRAGVRLAVVCAIGLAGWLGAARAVGVVG